MCDRHEGSPCLDLIIGFALAIPVYGALAWVAWVAWNKFTPWPLTYWQVLGILLGLAAAAGGIIAIRELRQTPCKRKENTHDTSSV